MRRKALVAALSALILMTVLVMGCAYETARDFRYPWGKTLQSQYEGTETWTTTAAARDTLRIEAENVWIRIEAAQGRGKQAPHEVEVVFDEDLHDACAWEEDDETVVSLVGEPFSSAYLGTTPVLVRVPSQATTTMRVVLHDAMAEIPADKNTAREMEIECEDGCVLVTSDDEFSGIGIDAKLEQSFCVSPGEATGPEAVSMGDSSFVQKGTEGHVKLTARNSFIVFAEDADTSIEEMNGRFADVAARSVDRTDAYAEASAPETENTERNRAGSVDAAIHTHAPRGLSQMMQGVRGLLHGIEESVGDLLENVADGV